MTEEPTARGGDGDRTEPSAGGREAADATAGAPTGVAALLAPTWHALVAPAQAYAALDARPLLSLWIIAWVLAGMVGASLLVLDVQRQFARIGLVQSMNAQGRTLEPEQLQRMLEAIDRFAPLQAIVGNLFLVLTVVLIAALLWMAATMTGGSSRFARAFAVASVGAVVSPLLNTLFVVLNWRLDPPRVRRIQEIATAVPSLGVDLLFGASDLSPAMHTLLARVDLFNLWWGVLVVMGCERLLRMRRGAAVTTAVVIWAAATAVAVGFAAWGSRGL